MNKFLAPMLAIIIGYWLNSATRPFKLSHYTFFLIFVVAEVEHGGAEFG